MDTRQNLDLLEHSQCNLEEDLYRRVAHGLDAMSLGRNIWWLVEIPEGPVLNANEIAFPGVTYAPVDFAVDFEGIPRHSVRRDPAKSQGEESVKTQIQSDKK